MLELQVDAIDERGQGIAAAEDTADPRSVLIPGLFPGERGEVRIEALSRHTPRAHARLRSVLDPSPARRELPCPRHEDYPPHGPTPLPDRPRPACGGCPLMAIEIDAQREAKRAWVAREFNLELDTLIGAEEFGYRWSSKRVVWGRAGRLILGSRVAGRQKRDRVADMRGCLVDHPLISAAFDALEDRGNALAIAPWTERGGEVRGDLRYIWAKTNGVAVILTLITGEPSSRAADELGPALVEAGVVAGVAHSVQSGAGNVIRGEATRMVAGVDHIAFALAGVELRVGPQGFLQPNPRVAALAYAELVGPDAGEPSGLACDLYAGAGVTTALLRERFAEVVPCESYPESAAALGVAPQTAEQFCREWLEAGREPPALIVANPPRAGLGEAVCADLLAIGAPRVHLMSCNPATLRADLDRLDPGYELVGLRGYDTLPQTPHLELVAWLRRRSL